MPDYIKETDNCDAVEFYIVSSVKGGCGKSSISFKLACEKENPCIIDLDVLGSTWSLISQFSNQRFIGNIYSVQDIDKRLIWKKVINGKEVSIVMNDSRQEVKQNYFNSIKNGNVPEIEQGIFKNNIIKIIEFLIENGYKSIILDMPPSFDIYSGPIFDYLCKTSTKIESNNKFKLHFVLVSPITVIGVNSIYDWIKDYFFNPKDLSYITDLNKISVTVCFVDIVNRYNPQTMNFLSSAVRRQFEDKKLIRFSATDIENIVVGFSEDWYNIANKEKNIEKFTNFIDYKVDLLGSVYEKKV